MQAALLAGVVGATGMVVLADTSGSGAATASPKNAVYRGAGAWGAKQIPGYETFVGHKMEYVLDFQATDTWANQAWPSWQSDAWKGRTVVLGATGIFPGDWNRKHNGVSVGWAQAARGDYDAHWKKLGERLVATGQSGAILRGAHEFNGGWFPHRVHPSEAPDFIKAWQRWVTIMRSVPGQNFTFDWNPTIGNEWPLYKPEIAYPGDAYVDRIALDVYDGWYNRGWKAGGAQPTAAERDAVWNHMLNGDRGMKYWKNFAIAHNKRMSLPEWGLRLWTESDGLIHGGGDNAVFIQRMAAIIKDPSWRIDYHAFWEDPRQGVYDPDGSGRSISVPKSRAAYLAAFGPGTWGTSSTTSTTKAPVTTTTTKAPLSTTTTTKAPTATTTTTKAPLSTTTTTVAASTTGTTCRAAASWELPLHFSPWNDRSWGKELHGRTTPSKIYPWAIDKGFKEVTFKVSNGFARTDTTAPFDVVAGNVWWAEKSLTLPAGTHSIKMIAKKSDGTCLTRTATYTIN